MVDRPYVYFLGAHKQNSGGESLRMNQITLDAFIEDTRLMTSRDLFL